MHLVGVQALGMAWNTGLCIARTLTGLCLPAIMGSAHLAAAVCSAAGLHVFLDLLYATNC
jgi:hypothetical protein